MRTLFIVILSIFLVPAIGLGVATLPYWHGAEMRNGVDIAHILTMCSLAEFGVSSKVPALLCEDLRLFNLLGAGSVLTMGLGLAVILIACLAALLTSWSRTLLAFTFPATALFSLIALSVIILSQAAIAGGSVFLAEAYFFDSVHAAFALFVAGTGGLIALALLRNVFVMFATARTSVIGVAASPTEAPHLTRVIRKMAAELNTKPPANIVFGFDPNFFATTAKVYTPFQKAPLRGTTLFLSLPLMRVLSREETMSIIGHELAHFSGNDTTYSRRFAPAYRGLGSARYQLSGGEDGSAKLWALPAIAIIDVVLGVFSMAERRISRARELRADQLGSEMGSPQALATSLIKLSVLAQIWQVEINTMVERVSMGRFSRNLSRNFLDRARHEVDHDKIAGIAALVLEMEVPHPTDTHPQTSKRLDALGVDPEPLIDYENFKASLFPETTIFSKADSIQRMEEDLSVAYQQIVLQSTGQDQSDETKQKNSVSNMLCLWLARMVTIDGDVDDTEIETAQTEAYRFAPDFDSTTFREICRHPEDIPATDKLLYWANIFLTEEGASKLKEILVKIAEADGRIDEAEQELLDIIEEGLVGGLEPDPVDP